MLARVVLLALNLIALLALAMVVESFQSAPAYREVYGAIRYDPPRGLEYDGRLVRYQDRVPTTYA